MSEPVFPLDFSKPRHFTGLNILAIKALSWRLIKGEIAVFKLVLLGPALQSLLFTVVIWLALGDQIPTIGGVPFLAFLTPGLVITAILQRAFETTAFMIVHEKLEGTIADIFGAPMRTGEILTGYVLGALGVSLIVGLPVWIILSPFGGGFPANPVLSIVFLVLGIILLSLLGMLAGQRSRKWDSLSAKEVFILAPALFLSGSFFSVDQLAEPFHTMMLLNPAFHLVNGFRYGMTGYADAPIWISFTVLTISLVVLLIATWRFLDRGYRIKA